MSGNDGRFSWPTALMTAFAVDRRFVAVAVAHARPTTRSSSSDQSAETHLGREADVLAQLERVGAAAEVVEQHVLRREVERPVVPLRERVAVVVVRVVDAATGIGVLEPRAADVVVLLDDDEGDAGLLQPVRGEQPRHARADDQHDEVDAGRELVGLPPRRAPVLAAVRELLLEQREVVRHLRAADGVLHDLEQLRRRRAAAPGRQPPSRNATSASSASCARLGLLLVGQPALRHPDEQRVGPQVRLSNDMSPVAYASAGSSGGISASARNARISSSDAVIGSTAATNGLDVYLSSSLAHASTPLGACCFMKPNR